MNKIFYGLSTVFITLLLVAACTSKKAQIVVNMNSIEPGSIVQKGTQQFQLIGTPLKVGMEMPDTLLIDGVTMNEFSFSEIRGKIAVVSIVPSLDTKVCEAQTHYLGEEGDRLPGDIVRVTVSRDTPFAQKRFAEAAKLTDIQYVSDHRDSSFGMATGLLIDKTRLLARGVLVVDRAGVVRYMQIVSQLGELPDMEKAFDFAIRLSRQP